MHFSTTAVIDVMAWWLCEKLLQGEPAAAAKRRGTVKTTARNAAGALTSALLLGGRRTRSSSSSTASFVVTVGWLAKDASRYAIHGSSDMCKGASLDEVPHSAFVQATRCLQRCKCAAGVSHLGLCCWAGRRNSTHLLLHQAFESLAAVVSNGVRGDAMEEIGKEW